jgi:hypothetical protein
MGVVRGIVEVGVPYVMLCGGEPLVVPHFMDVAEALGSAGIQLKIETNGQRLDARFVERLARLPIRSIQVSLDGDTQAVYERQRPGASLAKAHAACRAIPRPQLPRRSRSRPRSSISEAGAVTRGAIARRVSFQHRQVMRWAPLRRTWGKLGPTEEQYRAFRAELAGRNAS